MPFPFSYVCDLLDDLHQLHVRIHHLLPATLRKKSIERTSRWLKDMKDELNAFNTQSDAALWMLRPDKLDDRHYGVSAKTLQLIIGRTYMLSKEEMKVLRRWETQRHLGDFAVCVADAREAMQGIPITTKDNRVTVEEIQNTMLRIASKNPKSSLAVRSLSRDQDIVNPLQLLEHIYGRLSSEEAKWMTRYILKDYGAVFLPDSWTLESGHFGLPNCTPIQFDLFTRSPPVEILDGTKRVKATAATRVVAEKRRIETEGWSRPVPRSRESSPIARPRLKLMKQSTVPGPSKSKPEIQSSRTKSVEPASSSRESSPEHSLPMFWETGVLKPIQKRKRTEITALLTPVQTPKQTINPTQAIPNGLEDQPTTSKARISPTAAPSSVKSSGVDVHAKDPRRNHLAGLPTPSTLAKVSRSSTTMATSIKPKPSSSAMKTPIFIDLTDLPPRSGSPRTTPAPRPANNHTTPPSTTLTKPKPSTNTLDVSDVSILSKSTIPPRTALANVLAKASSRNHLISGPSNFMPTQTHNVSHPLKTAGSGKCRLGKVECPLIRCIILLSPSLAKNPRLINEYLPWHGLQYMTNLTALTRPQLPHCCPTTRLRYRKLVLVDTHNPKETASLLSDIEDLNLQHRVKRGTRDIKGNESTKEFVEVYDWRILEAMGKVDQGKKYDYDPWQRCLVAPI